MVLCLTSPGACKLVSSAIENLLLFRKSSAACSVSPLFATKMNSATVCGQSVRRLLPSFTWAWVTPADKHKLTNLTHMTVWDKPVFSWSVKQKSSMLQCTLLTEEPRLRRNERVSEGKLVLQGEWMGENYKPLKSIYFSVYLLPHVHPTVQLWGPQMPKPPSHSQLDAHASLPWFVVCNLLSWPLCSKLDPCFEASGSRDFFCGDQSFSCFSIRPLQWETPDGLIVTWISTLQFFKRAESLS